MKEIIQQGKGILGIEFGSTRIKAVLIDSAGTCLASGGHEWENRLEDGVWTYHLDDVWTGVQDCYRNLAADVQAKYGVALTRVAAIGVSGMMHGYLPFDEEGALLAPFRTWRNTSTGPAAATLTELLRFNIPQRWSIAHLYQAILNKEPHVPRIAHITTLAGYVHWQLTGEKVMGVGEASGMFPIDSTIMNYDQGMMQAFDQLIGDHGFPWTLGEILPKVLRAGDAAGTLTEAGARRLDPTGQLCAGIPLCPPEGDAGTGMTATNAVEARTGNVSAGTSIFAMVVLEKALSKLHVELDMVTTPAGKPVAMVHCNNCTNEINAWAQVFEELLTMMGCEYTRDQLFIRLFERGLTGAGDCGGLLAYNYLSGETLTGFEEGRPLFARSAKADFTLANFMRAQIYSSFATLAIGMEILEEEQVKIDRLLGHGGLFKTPGVAQRLMAAGLNAPISVMDTAGEGGPWGMALLASFLVNRAEGQSLEEYLSGEIFGTAKVQQIAPDENDRLGFMTFLDQYRNGLAIEQAAIDHIKA